MILVEEVEDLRNKSVQEVTIAFDPTTIPDETEFQKIGTIISLEKTNNVTFRLKIRENVDQLLKWLVNYTIARITIEDATLEEIFLQYYR